MTISKFVRLFLGCVLWMAFLHPAWGQDQNQWMDTLLPKDHLLENLPLMDEAGKIESKGLFDFEDMRGTGQQDILLLYRQSADVDELDKPNDQTLIIGFYDAQKKGYLQGFQDAGG